ncbi:phosphotransferase [Paenibacillus terreus]|uniref:Phosphotransferase n=1 Tax=Paenibacillus terreus TaxID=1387834 RepID=A0ABV5B371_9BACL
MRNDMEEGIRLLETKLSESVQTSVVHGDFHYDNIFWDEKTDGIGSYTALVH